MTDQTHADPVAAVLGWLRGHAGVLAAFGGVAHISGRVEAPWPHLRVAPGGGGDARGGVWSLQEDVVLEVIGAPDGTPGEAEMRRLTVLAATATLGLADRVHQPTDPVVSRVTVGTGRPAQAPWTVQAAQQITTSGQSRWTVTVGVTMRPPSQVPS